MKTKDWDIEKLKEIRSSGKTYKQIGEIYGVSRERIAQLIGRGKLRTYAEGYKRCYGFCKETLPISLFYKNTARCIKCAKKYVYKYVKRNYKNYCKGGKYWDKVKIRAAVARSIKNGKLIKENCFMKNNECKGRIEADHWHGYDKLHELDVRWVCQWHHKIIDKIGWGK